MREAGAPSTQGVARKVQHTMCVVLCACPPGIACSHRQSLQALDVDYNPIGKYKEAEAPHTVVGVGTPTPSLREAGLPSTSGKWKNCVTE
jgi:hypothetical protein